MELYSYPTAMEEALGAGMAGFFVAFYGTLLLFSIAMYIMQGIAFMNMAKKTGVRNGWLAFIPIGNVYIIGRIADAGKGNRKNTRRLMGLMIATVIIYVLILVLCVTAIISAPFSDTMPFVYLIPVILLTIAMAVVAICAEVFMFIAYYGIAQNFGGKDGTVYFVGILLGMFLMPVVSAVLFLILSGKAPKFTDAPVAIPVAATQTDSVF